MIVANVLIFYYASSDDGTTGLEIKKKELYYGKDYWN